MCQQCEDQDDLIRQLREQMDEIEKERDELRAKLEASK